MFSIRMIPELTGARSTYSPRGTLPPVEGIAAREARKYVPIPSGDYSNGRRDFLTTLGKGAAVALVMGGCGTINAGTDVRITPDYLKSRGYGHVVDEKTPTTTVKYTLGDNPYNLWRRITRLGNWWEIQAYEIVKKDIRKLTSEWAKAKIFTEQEAETIYNYVFNPSFFESRHKISDVFKKSISLEGLSEDEISKSLERLSEEMTRVARGVNPNYERINVTSGLSPEGELTLEIAILLATAAAAAAAAGAFSGGKAATSAAPAATTPAPGACFTSDTKVAMSNGSFKEISKIKIGDKVKSFDFWKNKKVNSKVTALFTFDKDSFLRLNSLKVTEKHPFAVGVDKWEEAGNLKVGDQVLGNNKITIKNIKRVNKPVSVFNITVNGTHNYYVSDNENAFLVHNKGIGGGCFIKESKVTMADKSTKNIEKIKIGEKVLGFNIKTKKFGKYQVTEKQVVKGKKGYFILNKKLKVSPLHKIYVNEKRKTAPEIKLNDTLVNGHKKTRVTSIEYVDKKADRHNIVLGRNKDILFMVNDVFVFNGW